MRMNGNQQFIINKICSYTQDKSGKLYHEAKNQILTKESRFTRLAALQVNKFSTEKSKPQNS